jgi:hypothetical protein
LIIAGLAAAIIVNYPQRRWSAFPGRPNHPPVAPPHPTPNGSGPGILPPPIEQPQPPQPAPPAPPSPPASPTPPTGPPDETRNP